MYRLDFYTSANDLSPGNPLPAVYLGWGDVETDASGNAPFAFLAQSAGGQFVTATATLVESGTLALLGTSEFSPDFPITGTPGVAAADLSVLQTAAPDPVPVGSNVTFTLSVGNAGPDPATGVRLVFTPPAGATFVSATGGVTPSGGTLTFPIATLAVGASTSFVVVVRPTAPGAFVSTLVAFATEADPASGDNTSTLTVTALDVTAPAVVKVLASSTKGKGTPIVLTFSEDLDPTRAAILANYRLVTAGRDKKFGTKDDKVVALRSATYNAATRSVTLLPRKKLSLGVKYRITVDGTSAHGIVDLAGTLLDGDRDGRASGNYVQIVKLVKASRSKAQRGS